MRPKLTLILLALAIVVGLTLTPLDIKTDTARVRVTIAHAAAAFEADYTCDGINDHLTFQDALDDLPDQGGAIFILAGDYTWGAGQTVTVTKPNVAVFGVGAATYIHGDGDTALFQAGADRWTFSNLRVDSGNISMTGTTKWLWLNVWVGSAHIPGLTADGGLGGGMEVHGNEYHTLAYALATDMTAAQQDILDAEDAIADLEDDVTGLQSGLSSALAAIDTLTEKAHWAGNDTSLGTQVDHLDMGGYDILNVGDLDADGIPDVTTDVTTIWVDDSTGSDSNPGTEALPKKTIGGALQALPVVIAHTTYVKVRPGTYNEADTSISFGRFICANAINLMSVNAAGEAMYDYGLATSSTSTTLVDSTSTWSADMFNGAFIWIYHGTGAGQVRQITDTTATTITVGTAWATNPSTDSYYSIGGGATLSAAAPYAVVISGYKQVNLYGFRITAATYASIAYVAWSVGTTAHCYVTQVASGGSAFFSQRLSDALQYWNYANIAGSGTEYGYRIIQSSAWVRGCIAVGDDSTGYGISTERAGIAQLTTSAGQLCTMMDCSIGTKVVEGSGCQVIASQAYVSCTTDYSVDSTSWNT